MREPSSILIVKPSSLGDVVHTLPAVARLHRRWPSARLHWLVNTEWAPLLEGNPTLERVIHFPRREFRGPAGWLRALGWTRAFAREKYDLVLDFQGLLRSALLGRLARGGALLGLSDAREGAARFYDARADVSGLQHAVDRYLRLAEFAGAPSEEPLVWPLPPGDAPPGFTVQEPFILLHPFSRGTGKSLSLEEIAELCCALAPHPVVLVGKSSSSVPAIPGVVDLLDRTSLAQLIWLIRRAAFTISVDSGPMHIAAALTPRLVSIHTWSDPRKVGPYRHECWVWQNGALTTVRDLQSTDIHRSLPTLATLGAWVVHEAHATSNDPPGSARGTR